MHVPHLISDLALMLASAGIITLLFKRLKQPLVLGYIIAGLLVGPNFHLFPTITDIDTIKIWADIGVIFLLFSLGLEFSFKKLVKVGGTSSVTGIFEVSAMLFIGYFLGQLMGWNKMDSIFLGGIISISSTTIIIKAFDELGLKTKKFAGVVLGVLVIEDLVAILLLVLLSTLAVSKNFSGWEMLGSVVKLVFFLVLWFLGGIYLLPTFFKRTRKMMTDETMLIVSVALCFLMVILATQVGFSSALGAFIMGSVLAETTQAEKIEHVTKSVKDLFGAVFFVSVGMLIDPAVLVQYAIPVLIITVTVILGKTINVSIGALIAGQPLKQSVQSGMSLSQIGEFSFIIATLGLTLKVTSDFLYPIAVGVSVITTFTTPYMMKLSDPVYNWLERILPQKWIHSLNKYSAGAQHMNAESDWKIVIRAFIQTIAINGVITIAIILLFVKIIGPFLFAELHSNILTKIIAAVLSLAIMAPFLWMLTVRRVNKSSYTALWLNKNNRGPIIVLEIVRVAIAIILVGFLLDQLFSSSIAFIIAIGIIIVSSIIFSRRLRHFSNRIETRFFSNLNERENEKIGNASVIKELLPWDAHLASFEVGVYSSLVGNTLKKIALRENYGVNVVQIERGRLTISLPSRDERLYPGDEITIIGTDDQINRVKPIIEAEHITEQVEQLDEINLHQVLVEPGFPFLGKTIRESGIREITKGLIVGIERRGERILNPESTMIIEMGDTLWLAGNKKLIKEMIHKI